MDKDYRIEQVYTALEQLKEDAKTEEQRQFWDNMQPIDVFALLYALEATERTAE